MLSGWGATNDKTDNGAYKGPAPKKKDDTDTFYTYEFDMTKNAIQYNLNVKPMSVTGTHPFVRENAKFLAELIKDSTGTILLDSLWLLLISH